MFSELFNLLINPEYHNFALRWHRDDVSEKATEEEEHAALQHWHYGVSSDNLKSSFFWVGND